MALFGTKKNTEKKDPAAKAPVKARAKAVKTEKAVAVQKPPAEKKVVTRNPHLAHIIIQPRITEKASMGAERGVYVFEVADTATKHLISAAVSEMYNVTPIKIAITKTPSKTVMIRNIKGIKK